MRWFRVMHVPIQKCYFSHRVVNRNCVLDIMCMRIQWVCLIMRKGNGAPSPKPQTQAYIRLPAARTYPPQAAVRHTQHVLIESNSIINLIILKSDMQERVESTTPRLPYTSKASRPVWNLYQSSTRHSTAWMSHRRMRQSSLRTVPYAITRVRLSSWHI